MYDSPIPNDREEGLQCVFKESGCAATNCDGCDVAKGDERNAWDTKCPGSEVLRVDCEGVVVGYVVLGWSAVASMEKSETDRYRAQTGQDKQELSETSGRQ